MQLRRAIFLDRDGVLNRVVLRAGRPFAPTRYADFRLVPGAAATVERFKSAGFLVVVVTNQPDLGHGLVDPSEVARMHAKLRRSVAVDDIRICPHRQDAGCCCRKPQPGLLLSAAHDHGIDLRSSYMIGDRGSDVLAGAAAGCYTVFVDRGYAETRALQFGPDAVVRSLRQGGQHILARLDHDETSVIRRCSIQAR